MREQNIAAASRTAPREGIWPEQYKQIFDTDLVYTDRTLEGG
jgi:hypothetical protein